VIALESIQGNSLHDYVQAVFEAAWSEKKDISDSAVLENCLPEGIDSSRFNELVESQDVKDDLKRRSDDALDRGVFGCPMFYVEDEPFWGKDRMQLIEDRLAG
jgi:2-hydroxychromene-2-carboxylate isomerase